MYCVYICVYLYSYTDEHKHTHVYIYIYIYIYIYTRMDVSDTFRGIMRSVTIMLVLIRISSRRSYPEDSS